MKYISLLCVILLILIVYYLYSKETPTVYVHRSSRPGPVILVIGGTHGNEPAGAVAAYRLHLTLRSKKIQNGTVVIVPNANRWGLRFGTRHLPAELLSFGLLGKSDLNRSYAHRGEEERTVIATKIQYLVKHSDWVIDLHEGYDFHKLNPQSMGSGIYPGQTKLSKEMTPLLVRAVNKGIQRPEYQFVTKEWPDEKGTLRMFCDENNVNYTLVETSGQDNIQPLGIRVRQHLIILRELLTHLQMW